MTQVLGILVLVVLPSLYFGRRVRRLSRASQDRVADSSAIAAEVLNAIPVVQSYVQEAREAQRFDPPPKTPSTPRASAPACAPRWSAFIITATFGALLWGLYQGTQAVLRRRHQRRPPGADGGLRDHLRRRGGGAVARSTATCCAPPARPSG